MGYGKIETNEKNYTKNLEDIKKKTTIAKSNLTHTKSEASDHTQIQNLDFYNNKDLPWEQNQSVNGH